MSRLNLVLILLTCCCFCLTSTKKEYIWKKCPNRVCLCRPNADNILMMCMNNAFAVIPPPPPSLGTRQLYLTLKYNNLPELTKNTFRNFRNVSVVSIIFYLNKIASVAEDTFSVLNRLEEVVFSTNQLSVASLANTVVSLKHVPLKRLTISNTKLRVFPSGFFTPLADVVNLTLSLVNNRITSYEGHLYEPLKGLVYLNLRSNRIKTLNMSENYVQNVSRLRLDDNLLDEFPHLCYEGESRFPQLTSLELKFNHIQSLFQSDYSCLQNLKRLYLNGNLLTELKKEQFVELGSLEVLGLSYMGYSLTKVHPESLHSVSLKRLYFRKNFKEFRRRGSRKSISFDIFSPCPSLELLNINFNVFSYLREADYDKVFRNLTNLKALIMGGGGLKYIPRAITTYLTNLTTLALYHNEIKDVPEHLNSLNSLTQLLLSNNEITSVKEQHIPSSIFHETGLIDLSNNPLSCGCESLWLILTFQHEPNRFINRKHPGPYVCHSPLHLSRTRLLDVPISEKKCLLTWNALMIVLVGSSVLITLLVFLSLLYYFRWNLMYMLFMMRYKERKVLDRREWQYDVFVAYGIEDIGWVKEKLMPVLEGKDKLKLCVHNRDFEVGKLIVDNIVDSVEKSRKIVIVLSNNFAKSSWCQFELDLILRHMIERGQRLLVVVLLEEIDQRYVTKSIRVMLQTTTYLEWGEENQVKQAFYNRLRLLVKRPVSLTQPARNRKLSV